MDTVKQEVAGLPKMSLAEFTRISEYIYSQYGIKLPPVKKTMLESRLHKRLRARSYGTFKDYFEFVFSKEGQELELIQMVDLITTNKTDFFREATHFSYLTETLLPAWGRANDRSPVKVWSAGCSSGEEPYTLAMVLAEFGESNGGLSYSILGTDLSQQVLQHAVRAVYTEEKAAGIPLSLKKKYLLRAKDKGDKTVRIVPALRSKASFVRLNFMDASYDVPGEFDIIFCRNVLIYFDRATQHSVVNKLCEKLKPGGYLFLGHSESITGMSLPLQQVKPTIFSKS